MSSIKKNFVYNSAYQILLIFIPLITTPYISRVLGAEGIGTYSYAYSIANYFSIFILLGLNNYGNRAIAQVRDKKDELSKMFCSIYIMQFILGIIVTALYFAYCFLFSNTICFSIIMSIYVVSCILDVNWFFFGLEKFKFTVLRNTIIKIITTISIFCFVKNETDVWKYCLIMVLSMLVSQIVLWPYIFKEICIQKVSIRDITVHIKPNLLLFLTVLATSLFKIMDKIMLGAITAEKTQVGFYESSEKIIAIPTALIISLGTVMLPRMTNLVSNGDKNSKSIIKNSIVFAVFLSSSLCFGIMALSNTFVLFFYGEGFEVCVDLFIVLLPSCVFLAFANVIRTQYLLPNHMDKAYVLSAFLGAGVNLTINFLLIPRMGAIGAAVGTLSAEGAVCIFQTLSVRKFLPLKEYIKSAIPYVLSGILMFLIVFPIIPVEDKPLISMFIQFLIGVAVYFLTLIIQELIYRKIKGTSLLNLKEILEFIHVS